METAEDRPPQRTEAERLKKAAEVYREQQREIEKLKRIIFYYHQAARLDIIVQRARRGRIPWGA